MIALSPGLSWLLFGGWFLAVVLIVAFFMGASRVTDRVMGPWGVRDADPPSFTFAEPAEPLVRIISIYDHEARGDLDHLDYHDPTIDHDHCETCNALLRRALVKLADRLMGPRDADGLMAAIREELES